MHILEIKNKEINKQINLGALTSTTLIVGDNGNGKTLVLETIYSVYEAMNLFANQLIGHVQFAEVNREFIRDIIDKNIGEFGQSVNDILPTSITLKINKESLKEVDFTVRKSELRGTRYIVTIYYNRNQRELYFRDPLTFVAELIQFMVFGKENSFSSRMVNPMLQADRVNIVEYEKARMFTRMQRLRRRNFSGHNSIISWKSDSKEYIFNVQDNQYSFSELSSGFKSIAVLSLYMSTKPQLIFIDEPEAHLSTKTQINLMKEIINKDTTIVMATHSDILCRIVYRQNNDTTILLIDGQKIIGKSDIQMIDRYFEDQFNDA